MLGLVRPPGPGDVPIPTNGKAIALAADIDVELHLATLDDRHAQVTERTQQSLLGDPFQSLAWSFAAGETDRFVRKVVCGKD